MTVTERGHGDYLHVFREPQCQKRVGITVVDADFKLGLVIVLSSDLLRKDLTVLRSVAI